LSKADKFSKNKIEIVKLADSLVTLPQQLLEAHRLLSDSTVRLQSLHVPVSPLAEAQYNLAQTEVTVRKSKTNELEIAQLSANNRQEISRLRIELFKKKNVINKSTKSFNNCEII